MGKMDLLYRFVGKFENKKGRAVYGNVQFNLVLLIQRVPLFGTLK